MKKEWTRRILIPLDTNSLRKKLTTYMRWYNFFRPHQGLDGATPAEIYIVKSQKENVRKFDRKEKLQLLVTFYKGDRQLPIIRLKRAA